jgi:uncharacterized protein (DUF934 family)
MGTLIRQRRIVRDSWWLLSLDTPPLATPPGADLLVPLALWREQRERLAAHEGRTGVLLAAGDDPAAIAADLARLPLVAIRFDRLTDGRGYSTAALLRSTHGYRGELRAIGDIGRDQLAFLERCGFDAFELRDREDPHAALLGFGEVSVAYQPDAAAPARARTVEVAR